MSQQRLTFELLDLRRWDNCLQGMRGIIDELYALAANMGGPGSSRPPKASSSETTP
jgi:hypothetical protein